MSNSKLATITNLSPNRNSPRNQPIDRITIHCFVGQVAAARGCEVFAPKAKRASCNYVVGRAGDIGLCVDEGDRSWCSSSAANDNRAVTIEVASDTTHPYAVTDAAYNALVDLVEDICRRNGKHTVIWLPDKTAALRYETKPGEMQLTVHRWFAKKSCPGDYLFERHQAIADEVNRRLGDVAPSEARPGPEVPFRIRVNRTDVRIYGGPGKYTGIRRMCPRGTYTITETATGDDAKLWGRLKSGAGWIPLAGLKTV